MTNNKRDLLKIVSLAGVTGAAWKKPVVNSLVLPAHASTSGGGCVEIDIGYYADFDGGNYLPPSAPVYTDSECVTLDNSTLGCHTVYVPDEEISTAEAICAENGQSTVLGKTSSDNAYVCGEC